MIYIITGDYTQGSGYDYECWTINLWVGTTEPTAEQIEEVKLSAEARSYTLETWTDNTTNTERKL